jgi:ribonuclease P protein component
MLPKNRRIPRELFKSILEKGRYSNSPHFSVKVSPEGEKARVAVSVSKKVAKRAVARNRARRRAYSALQELVPTIRPGLYLISTKSGAQDLKGDVLKDELRELLSNFLIK